MELAKLTDTVKLRNEALRLFLATTSLILTAMLVNPAASDWVDNSSSSPVLAQEDSSQSTLNRSAKEQSAQNVIEKKLGLNKKALRKVAKLR